MTGSILVVIAVMLRIVSNPLANVLQKKLSLKDNNPLVVNFLTYSLLSVFCCIFFCFLKISDLSKIFWIYSILGGIAGAIGNGFLIRALQLGDLSVLGPINSYKSVIGLFFGMILLSEIPNIWGIIGIVLIIYGSYFVLNTIDEKFSWKQLKRSGIQYRIIAVILTAVEAVFIKKVIIASSPLFAFMSWCIFGAFFSLIILYFYKINLRVELKKTIKIENTKIFLLLILCIGTMQFTTNWVFNYMPVAYALSLFQLSTIVSVIFGYRFFQEKEIVKKIIGAIIMIVGSVLIILF